jgi:hypothetical protein
MTSKFYNENKRTKSKEIFERIFNRISQRYFERTKNER